MALGSFRTGGWHFTYLSRMFKCVHYKKHFFCLTFQFFEFLVHSDSIDILMKGKLLKTCSVKCKPLHSPAILYLALIEVPPKRLNRFNSLTFQFNTWNFIQLKIISFSLLKPTVYKIDFEHLSLLLHGRWNVFLLS